MKRNKHLQAIIEEAEKKLMEAASNKASDAAANILNEHSPMFNALSRLDELLCACWMELLVMPHSARRTRLSLLVDRIDIDLDLAHERGAIHELIMWDGSGGESLIKELNDAFEVPGQPSQGRPHR